MSGFRWISPIPDRRLNGGVKESWFFESKDQAINDAIQIHTKKPAPAETAVRDWVWRQMEGLGWSITDEKRR